MTACSNRIPFVDGEFDTDAAREFRAHLSDCTACRADVLVDLQLGARLSTLSPQVLAPRPDRHVKLYAVAYASAIAAATPCYLLGAHPALTIIAAIGAAVVGCEVVARRLERTP